jgi:hypothetical protein
MKHAASATILLAFVCSALAGQSSPPTDEVMKTDEQFRLAKLNRDTAALSRILADNFYETNQNGNGRNKTQIIELFTSFPIASLTIDSADVRITGDTAVVTGSQSERNSTGVDRMLYMRVYVRGGAGWQLLACMQFRNPKL